MSETEWFCGVQLGGVKLPAEFPAARNSKSMVHAGTGRWRQKNGRPMLIVGSRLAVYRMAVLTLFDIIHNPDIAFIFVLGGNHVLVYYTGIGHNLFVQPPSSSLMRGITNVDTRQVALPLLWLSGSAISPAQLFK